MLSDSRKPCAPVREVTVQPEPWRLWISPCARSRSVTSRITAALTLHCSASTRPDGSFADGMHALGDVGGDLAGDLFGQGQEGVSMPRL